MSNGTSDKKTENNKTEALEINFATFVLSLASSAQVHLGLVPNPATKKTEVALHLAKQTIDILEMIEKKTKGNLEENENKLLEQLLYELRMQYMEIKAGGKNAN